MSMVYADTVATGDTSLNAATHSPPPQLVAIYKIPQDGIYTFTTHKKFKEDLQRCEDAFISGVGNQYIAFRDVNQSYLLLIERRRSRSELPPFRLHYDAAEEVLITKLRPGAHHEVANMKFENMIYGKLYNLQIFDTLVPFGSTTYQAPSGISKEPDSSWRPSTRVLPTDQPSLVIEVGVSESLSELCSDAHFWLTQTGGQTGVVILLAVNRDWRVTTIERWELAPTTRPTRASTSSYNPTKMQVLTVDHNGTVNGGPLLIPASKVYDTLPAGLGQNDLTFTAQELAQYIQLYWQLLG